MVFLKDYSIKNKIKLSIIFVVIVISSMLISVYYFQSYLQDNFYNMNKKELHLKNTSHSLKDKIFHIHKYVLVKSLLQEQKEIEQNIIQKLNKQILEHFKDIEILLKPSNNKDLLEISRKLNIRYKSYYNIAKGLPQEFSSDFEDGISSLVGLSSIAQKMFKELDVFINYSDKEFNNRIKHINQNMSKAIITFITVGIIVLILSMLFGYVLKNTILNSLTTLDNGLEHFFNFLGQKTDTVDNIQIKYNDEFGEIANRINENIQEVEYLINNERKFKENLQQKVEEKTKELQNSTDLMSENIMYSRTDLDGIIVEASNRFCEISGYSRDELIGQPHSIVRHHNTPSSLFKNMWETIKSGKPWKGKIENSKKDGTSYVGIVKIVPEFDEDGNIVNYLGIRIDITAEETVKILDKELKTEIEKNIKRELQLFEQSKMAQMGEMIGNIAHQWRQPLSTISTIASGIKTNQEYNMLKVEELPQEMDKITQKTQYLSEIIDTFRNFLMEKKERKEVIIQDRIDVSLNIINVALTDNKIELINNVDYSEPIKITLVVGEISEVIINIINNAKDVLLEKDIKNPWIKLDLKKYDETVIITIEDNGGGIPSDIMPKIFNPYFTTKHQSQGTGLGLHMSYQIIVDSLKGKLYAKNTENGAKFFIELPLDQRMTNRRQSTVSVDYDNRSIIRRKTDREAI